MKRRRRTARNARWFAGYTLVMLAVAAASITMHEYSIAFTVLLTAAVFGGMTWFFWRKSRRPSDRS